MVASSCLRTVPSTIQRMEHPDETFLDYYCYRNFYRHHINLGIRNPCTGRRFRCCRGALALFAIIAAGVEHERKAEKKKQHTTKPRVVRQPIALPGRCVRRLENNQGTRRVVARGCLERHYAAAGSLPRYCATRFKNARGNTRKGYDLRCLRSDGYRVIR